MAEFGAATRARLAKLNAQIDGNFQRMGMLPATRVADPRVGYLANNTDIALGANSPLAFVPPAPPSPAQQRMAAFKNSLNADMMRVQNQAESIINPPSRPAPAPVAVAPAEPAPLRMGLADNPRLQFPIGALPAAPAPVIPIPRAKPAPTSYTVQKGDNPSKIAKSLGLTLQQLEERNPGLIKRARSLQIGEKLEV